MDQKNKVMGVGIIARDHNGHVRASMCTITPYVLDSTVAEAFAVWQHYKKHCKSPRVYSTGYCRHAARWLRVLLATWPYAA
jgi:hypothetical protein